VQDQLHDEEGPALRFRDGTALYFLHGEQVRPQIAESSPDEIPLSWWLDEPMVKKRQVIEQKIGAARIANELRAWEVHRGEVIINGREYVYQLLQLRVPGRGVGWSIPRPETSTPSWYQGRW
jgi:hypothetical protein